MRVKKIMLRIWVIAVFIVAVQSAVYAQRDSTRYIFGLPVSEDDTAGQFIEGDIGPKNKLQIVTTNELPAELREVLDKEVQFRGWQDTLIYYNRKTELFVVPLRQGETIKIYGLNENGKPVTYDEESKNKP